MVFVTGGAGGSVNQYNGLTNNWEVTQSWTQSIINPYGVDVQIHSTQDEFYNGEFSGSWINTDNGGELNLANPFKQVNPNPTTYNVELYGGDGAGGTPTSSAAFISSVVPTAGNAAFWSQNPAGGPLGGIPPYIQYAKIYSLDLANENNGLTLADVESIIWRGFTFYPITISPRDGGNYYFFEFAPGNSAQYLLSDPQPYSNQILVLSPKISDATGPFQNNDYNAIMNNAIENRLNSKIQVADYSTNQNIPINILAILSGSATRASIPDSNYTSLWWDEIRYLGSKNTTDDLNSISTTQSLVVQNYLNENIGATTLGQASIDQYNTNIYEFAWGGGAYPQIATAGAVKLNQILDVNSTSSVANISPQDIFFSFSVQSNLPPNSQPQITQRSTTVNIPNTVRVLTSEFGVPSISNYYIPSGSTTFGGAAMTGSFTTLSLYGGFLTNLIAVPGIDNNGRESVIAAVTGSTPATITSTISASLAAGERWFVSIYYNLGTTASGSLAPVNNGYDTISGNGSYAYPLEANGVYEIDRVSPTHANDLILTKAINVNLEMGSNAGALTTGYAAAGCLIWKAITDGTFVVFNGSTLSGVGKGSLITPNASPIIKNELGTILTRYGI
jgi:hypothetical protein